MGYKNKEYERQGRIDKKVGSNPQKELERGNQYLTFFRMKD